MNGAFEDSRCDLRDVTLDFSTADIVDNGPSALKLEQGNSICILNCSCRSLFSLAIPLRISPWETHYQGNSYLMHYTLACIDKTREPLPGFGHPSITFGVFFLALSKLLDSRKRSSKNENRFTSYSFIPLSLSKLYRCHIFEETIN